MAEYVPIVGEQKYHFKPAQVRLGPVFGTPDVYWEIEEHRVVIMLSCSPQVIEDDKSPPAFRGCALHYEGIISVANAVPEMLPDVDTCSAMVQNLIEFELATQSIGKILVDTNARQFVAGVAIDPDITTLENSSLRRFLISINVTEEAFSEAVLVMVVHAARASDKLQEIADRKESAESLAAETLAAASSAKH